jgi:hypothetical protein
MNSIESALEYVSEESKPVIDVSELVSEVVQSLLRSEEYFLSSQISTLYFVCGLTFNWPTQ